MTSRPKDRQRLLPCSDLAEFQMTHTNNGRENVTSLGGEGVSVQEMRHSFFSSFFLSNIWQRNLKHYVHDHALTDNKTVAHNYERS